MDWLDDSAAISLGTLGQEKRMKPLTVSILNTTPEQRKPQAMPRAISFLAGCVALVTLILLVV